MKNKLFQEIRTKDCQEIEEFAKALLSKRVTELDKQNWMNCPWCNRGIFKQWVNSWLRWESHRIKWIPCLMRENFMILKTADSSGASHVTSPPLTNPSYRTVPRRDSGLPPETLNMMSISDVFERLPAREGQPQNISKNHGIWHLLLVECNQNLQNIRWQQDRRGDLSNKTYPIRETSSTV